MLVSCDTDDGNRGGFVFEHDSVRYAVGDDVSGVLPSLSGCRYTEQSAGCGIEEVIGVYSGDCFRLEVGERAGARVILRITLTNPSAKTAEGIAIGTKSSDVIRTYGDGYTSRGRYLIYKKEESLLCFGVKDGRVVSIYYEYDES